MFLNISLSLLHQPVLSKPHSIPVPMASYFLLTQLDLWGAAFTQLIKTPFRRNWSFNAKHYLTGWVLA